MKEELYRKVINPVSGKEILEPLTEHDIIQIANGIKRHNAEELPWERENRSQEDIDLLKEIAREATEDAHKKHNTSSKGSGAT